MLYMKHQVNFRLESDLIAKCKRKAELKNQTFTAWLVSVLEAQFPKEES